MNAGLPKVRIPKLPSVKLPDPTKACMGGLSPDEIEVLMDFYSRGSKTMGQIVSNRLAGSKAMDAIEKLRDFGFIRRDWEKEIELGVDVVYSLTGFGSETAKKYIKKEQA